MEELVAKYLSGEASEDEKVKVEEWRAESEENARAFYEYKVSWSASIAQEAPNHQMLSDIFGANQELEETKIVPLWQQRPFQVAASIIVIVGVLFALLKPNYEDQAWGQILTEKTVFQLPDGSEVTVQKGGSLTMGDFEKTREVTMTGKAYFDVERDESKPFIIQTENSQIRVLGTSFVVDSNEKELITEVMVESGLVAFGQNEKYFGRNTMEIQLGKGEMGILAVGEKGIKKKKISDDNYLSWQNQILTFNRTRLSNVGEVLNDVYGLDVSFESSVLGGCYLTAKYNKKSSEEVVKLIAETFNMTYELDGDQVTFKGEGCQ